MNVHGAKLCASVAGTLAPITFVVLILGLGMLESGHNHMTDMMSLLGGVEGIRGCTFNIGVMTIGLLVVAFAIGLHHTLDDGHGSKAGPVMLAIGGIGMIGGGVFHCDENCVNVLTYTSTGIMHLVSALIAGMFTALSLFFIYLRLRGSPQWRSYSSFTLVMAILGNAFGILLWITYATSTLDEIQGLLQRLGIVFPLIWIGVFSSQMLHKLRS